MINRVIAGLAVIGLGAIILSILVACGVLTMQQAFGW